MGKICPNVGGHQQNSWGQGRRKRQRTGGFPLSLLSSWDALLLWDVAAAGSLAFGLQACTEGPACVGRLYGRPLGLRNRTSRLP